MYELFYTWLLPTSLAGALASLLVRALAPLLNRLSWRWQRRAMGCAAGFFLLPVGPLLALLPGIKRSTGLEPVGQALENAAQAAVHTVNLSTEPVMTAPLAQPVQPVQPQLAGQLLAVLPWLWALGAVLFTLWQLVGYLRFCRALHRLRGPLSEKEQSLLRRVSLESGHIAPLRAWVCPGVRTPLLVGVLRPELYLPRDMEEEALELALRHELAHLNSGDLWGKAALRLARRIHWFNPACHWQAARLERVCELACDEAAVRGLNKEQRKAYGRVLLAAAAGPLPAGASGMSAGPENLKARLLALFEQPKASRRQILAAAAGLLAAVCLTACAAAGLSAGEVASSASLAENGLEQLSFLQQQSRQATRETVPTPMPEPEEKPALAEGQASVQWIRVEQSVAGQYDYEKDETLLEGQYVIERSAANGLDEVSGWAFYDEQGLLVDYREVDRITLQTPVKGIVRYNGDLQFIQSVVEKSEVGQTGQQSAESGETTVSLIWPVPGYTYVSRWMNDYHKGADLVAPSGTEVCAMAAGMVTTAGYHYSYGNYVIIEHAGGMRTLYAHLDSLNVGVNTQAEQGAVIGTVGSTGNSTGNACHVEVYVNGERRGLQEWFPDY